MITKVYRTRELKGLTIPMEINGVKKYISFKRGCTLGSTATLTTSDPRIQEELESLSAFGRTYYIEREIRTEDDTPKVEEKPKEAPAPAVEEEKEVFDILDAQTFKNLVELRNALTAKGIDVPSNITNVKAAESFAKKNGYNYTIEKNA